VRVARHAVQTVRLRDRTRPHTRPSPSRRAAPRPQPEPVPPVRSERTRPRGKPAQAAALPARPTRARAQANGRRSRIGRDLCPGNVVAHAGSAAAFKLEAAPLALVPRDRAFGLRAQSPQRPSVHRPRRGTRLLPHPRRACCRPRARARRARVRGRARRARWRLRLTSSFLWRLSTHTRRSSRPLGSTTVAGALTGSCPSSSIVPCLCPLCCDPAAGALPRHSPRSTGAKQTKQVRGWVFQLEGRAGGRQEETHAQCRECPTLMSDSDDDKPLGCGPPRLSAPRAAAIMARAGPRRGSPASRLSARLPRAPRRRAGRQAGRRGTARAWGGGVRSAWRQRLPLASARGYERAERTLSRERGRAWRERGRARGHLFRCSGSHHVCPHPRPCGFACHPRPVRAASVSPWPGARSAAVKSEVRLRDLGARTAVCDGLRGGAAGLRGCRSGRGGAVGGRASIGSLCSLIRVRLVHMRRRSSPPHARRRAFAQAGTCPNACTSR